MLEELVYLKYKGNYYVAVDAEKMSRIDGGDSLGSEEDDIKRRGAIVPWSKLPNHVQESMEYIEDEYEWEDFPVYRGDPRTLKNRIVFFKYKNGNAYYYAEKHYYDSGRDFDAIHLLSGGSYETRRRALTKPIPWEDIPESFRLDAIANNPFIRDNYGKQGEYNTMFGEQASNEMFDFGRFGQINTDDVRMSPKGLAIKMTTKKGQVKYRAWDQERNIMVDVTGLTMPLGGMLFLMPSKKLEAGDIIEHDGEYTFVKEVGDKGEFTLLGPSGELAQHIKQTSLMGFNFYKKVVTPMKRFGSGGDGIMSMMKMQMMSGMMGGDAQSGGGMQQMLMFQMMTGEGDMFKDMFDMDGLFDLGDEPKAE